ncbi:MAG TPA: hypothetical protein VML96_05865 [Egibacteraceae bacterium]|nr:hypothetical protein [Egibacteraceae bacterium]
MAHDSVKLAARSSGLIVIASLLVLAALFIGSVMDRPQPGRDARAPETGAHGGLLNEAERRTVQRVIGDSLPAGDLLNGAERWSRVAGVEDDDAPPAHDPGWKERAGGW